MRAGLGLSRGSGGRCRVWVLVAMGTEAGVERTRALLFLSVLLGEFLELRGRPVRRGGVHSPAGLALGARSAPLPHPAEPLPAHPLGGCGSARAVTGVSAPLPHLPASPGGGRGGPAHTHGPPSPPAAAGLSPPGPRAPGGPAPAGAPENPREAGGAGLSPAFAEAGLSEPHAPRRLGPAVAALGEAAGCKVWGGSEHGSWSGREARWEALWGQGCGPRAGRAGRRGAGASAAPRLGPARVCGGLCALRACASADPGPAWGLGEPLLVPPGAGLGTWGREGWITGSCKAVLPLRFAGWT